MRRSLTISGALGATLVLATGCGSGDGAPSAEAAPGPPAGKQAASRVTVRIKSFRYRPESIQVRAGGRVTWIDEDEAPHTATAENGSFDTDRLDTGERSTMTFADPGTYRYYCVYHRFMQAVVNVEERGA